MWVFYYHVDMLKYQRVTLNEHWMVLWKERIAIHGLSGWAEKKKVLGLSNYL
jgi:hypothetical protein